MHVWKPVFLHEFPDGNLSNLRALPGSVSVGVNGTPLQPNPEPDERGFELIPGNAFSYQFDDPASDVIGIDIAIRLVRRPVAMDEHSDGRVELGNGAVKLLFHFIGTTARVQLQFQDSESDLATSIVAPLEGAFTLRVRWHNHGQAHVWIDGKLCHYRASVAPGIALAISDIVVRHHADFILAGATGLRVRRVLVKLLRRDDAARLLDGLVPIDPGDGLSPACAKQLQAIQQAAAQKMRSFMRSVIPRISSDWRAGDAGQPFSEGALNAHQAAETGASNLVRFLLDGDAAAGSRAIADLGKFLEIIATVDPTGYATLLAEIDALSDDLKPECRAEFEALAERNADAVAVVVPFLKATDDAIRAVSP